MSDDSTTREDNGPNCDACSHPLIHHALAVGCSRCECRVNRGAALTPEDFRALYAQQQARRDAPDGVPLNLSGREEKAGRISYACPAVGYDAVMHDGMPFYFCPACGIPCGVVTMRRHVVPEHDHGIPIEVPEAERYRMRRHHANTPLLQAAHTMGLSRDWVIDLLLRALMDQTAATEKAMAAISGQARIVLTGIEKPS